MSIGAGNLYTPARQRSKSFFAVFRIAAGARVPIHAHIRRGVAGLDEALKLAAATEAPPHVVHINSTGVDATRELLQMIDGTKKRGMDVTTEAYPYAAGMTKINLRIWTSIRMPLRDRVARLE